MINSQEADIRMGVGSNFEGDISSRLGILRANRKRHLVLEYPIHSEIRGVYQDLLIAAPHGVDNKTRLWSHLEDFLQL